MGTAVFSGMVRNLLSYLLGGVNMPMSAAEHASSVNLDGVRTVVMASSECSLEGDDGILEAAGALSAMNYARKVAYIVCQLHSPW